MDIFIGYNSALQFWRENRVRGYSLRDRKSIASAARRNKSLPSKTLKPDVAQIKAFGRPSGIRDDLMTVIVRSPEMRVRTKSLLARVWPNNRTWMFVRIDDVYLVSVPEACFVQLAHDLDLVALIQIGYELCGTYSMLPGFTSYDACQIASANSISRVANSLKGIRGYRNARLAARYIVDGSASPAETQLCMMLTLPSRFGGYGLPAPALNQEIKIPEQFQRRIGHRVFRCDLLWTTEKGRVAVEYKSNEWHLNEKSMTSDARRNNALKELGVNVIEITAAQLYDANAMEEVVVQISKAIGHRYRYRARNQISKRFELRNALLGKSNGRMISE